MFCIDGKEFEMRNAIVEGFPAFAGCVSHGLLFWGRTGVDGGGGLPCRFLGLLDGQGAGRRLGGGGGLFVVSEGLPDQEG